VGPAIADDPNEESYDGISFTAKGAAAASQRKREQGMAHRMSSSIAQVHIDAAGHLTQKAAAEDRAGMRRAYVVAALDAALNAARAELRIITGTDPLREDPIADLDVFLSLLGPTPPLCGEQRLLRFASKLAGEAGVELKGENFDNAVTSLLTVEFAKWGIAAVIEYVERVKSGLVDMAGLRNIVVGSHART
jgi:hypothetical protein